jgi:hypothetical protein
VTPYDNEVKFEQRIFGVDEIRPMFDAIHEMMSENTPVLGGDPMTACSSVAAWCIAQLLVMGIPEDRVRGFLDDTLQRAAVKARQSRQ